MDALNESERLAAVDPRPNDPKSIRSSCARSGVVIVRAPAAAMLMSNRERVPTVWRGIGYAFTVYDPVTMEPPMGSGLPGTPTVNVTKIGTPGAIVPGPDGVVTGIGAMGVIVACII